METTMKCNGLKYEEDKWNGEYSIRNYTNCYTYAINVMENPKTKEFFTDWKHVQPGNLGGVSSNFECWNIFGANNVEKLISEFINAVQEDLKSMSYQIVPSTFEETVDEDSWKVALCFGSGDYHWYRLNDDGTWSHKQGRSSVCKGDNNGEIITNPETCNRGSYKTFVGFYMIKKL